MCTTLKYIYIYIYIYVTVVYMSIYSHEDSSIISKICLSFAKPLIILYTYMIY